MPACYFPFPATRKPASHLRGSASRPAQVGFVDFSHDETTTEYWQMDGRQMERALGSERYTCLLGLRVVHYCGGLVGHSAGPGARMREVIFDHTATVPFG